MVGIRQPPQRLSAPPAAGLRRRFDALWPDLGCAGDAHDVIDLQLPQRFAEFTAAPIACIRDRQWRQGAGRSQLAQQRDRDRRLRRKRDLLRHFRLAPPLGVLGPLLRQIQPIPHRQAVAFVGHRDAHGDLAIVLLAQLTAVLPRHAHRVPSLPGKPGFIDQYRFGRPRACDYPLPHIITHSPEQCRVRPRRVSDKMVQTLMLRAHAIRREDALRALDRRVRRDDVLQPDMIAWLGRALDELEARGIELAYCARHLNRLADAVATRVAGLASHSRRAAFRDMLGDGPSGARLSDFHAFHYPAVRYPARWLYSSRASTTSACWWWSTRARTSTATPIRANSATSARSVRARVAGGLHPTGALSQRNRLRNR